MSLDPVVATLGQNRADALRLAQAAGSRDTRRLLQRAERELKARLHAAEGLSGAGRGSFTATQLRSSLAQVHAVLVPLTRGMRSTILDHGKAAAQEAGAGTVKYLRDADKAFTGVSEALPIREVSVLSEAVSGAEASLLRRLAVTDQDPGVLGRYGVNTIALMERELQIALVTKKPWEDVRAGLIAKSPFLQGQPAYWAERIVRTETMGAYNRAGWEAIREADAQLGDMVKILSAHFDDRTGSDSYAVHGQIRRPEQAFEWWDGLYQHPPNRPNDREVVVPHRVTWPIPPALRWRTDDQIAARWAHERRRGAPPDRPTMTTIPLSRFGRSIAARRTA